MNHPDTPSVVILIVNWNNYQDTKKCLVSLDRIRYPNVSIWVIDNGSEDGSPDKLQAEFPDVRVLFLEDNLGFAGGNNQGIQEALEQGYDYILLLNNDTEIIQGSFLGVLVQEIETCSKIGAIGPQVMRPDGRLESTILPYPTLWVTIKNTLGFYQKDLGIRQQAESITGCCVLINSAAVRDAGLLDENFFMYAEETEWFHRMREKGWIVMYIPIASVIHKGGATSKNLISSQVYIERRANVIYTLVKHNHVIQAFLTGVFMLVLLGIRLLIQSMLPGKKMRDRYSATMLWDLLIAFSEKWNQAVKVRSAR